MEYFNQIMDTSFTLHKLIGIMGGVLLSFCGLPEAIRSIKTKTCSIGHAMLISWGLGEILLFMYVLPTKDLPLILNYGINVLFIGVMYFYKIFGRKNG